MSWQCVAASIKLECPLVLEVLLQIIPLQIKVG